MRKVTKDRKARGGEERIKICPISLILLQFLLQGGCPLALRIL